MLEVKWPTTQKVEAFANVEPNQILTIKEGSGIIQKMKPGLKANERSEAGKDSFETHEATVEDVPTFVP